MSLAAVARRGDAELTSLLDGLLIVSSVLIIVYLLVLHGLTCATRHFGAQRRGERGASGG